MNDITGEAQNGATRQETSNERSTDVTDQECHVVESVEENKEGFTQCKVNQAKHAWELYTMCIKPTVQNLKHLISGNFVKNFPVTVEDISNAERIYGPDIATLKGKSVRCRLLGFGQHKET